MSGSLAALTREFLLGKGVGAGGARAVAEIRGEVVLPGPGELRGLCRQDRKDVGVGALREAAGSRSTPNGVAFPELGMGQAAGDTQDWSREKARKLDKHKP